VHSGVLTIKATNPIGTAQHEMNINVLGKHQIAHAFCPIGPLTGVFSLFPLQDVPKINGKVENVSINEGQVAEFTCKFISNPAASKITWFKNESEELAVGESVEITNTADSSVLKLSNCKLSDTGSFFIVKITNDLGECTSNKATLNVSSGPVFVTEPTDQNVLKDKEAKFECVVKSNPKPNVIWLFNGKEFTAKDGVRVEKDVGKDKYILVLPKVTPAHIGTITARATNEFGTSEKSCQLDVLEAPKVNNKLDNLTVNEGEQAKFTVKFGGKPKPAVKWFKDDVEVQLDETVEIVESAEDEVTLVIKASKSLEHSGNYSAKVANEFGEVVTNKATLTVNSKRNCSYGLVRFSTGLIDFKFTGAPKFLSQPQNTVAVQDQPARFECLVDSLPKAKLTWLLNGKELTNKDNIKFETDAKTSAVALVIPKVLASHCGTYTIKATNSVGEAEATFVMDTLGKRPLEFFVISSSWPGGDVQFCVCSLSEIPKVIGKLENTTVNEGQEAKFTVKFSGKPRPTVKWFKEEEEIVITVETYEIVETEDSVTLIIKSAKPEHTGNYSAQLTNEAGQASTNKALLTVNRAPVFVKVPEPLAPINKDESLRLECIVEATPKPTINW
jgi:hypothetical protein